MIEWPDGINPHILNDEKIDGPARVQAILDTRKARAAELEAWKKGAGDEYLSHWSRR